MSVVPYEQPFEMFAEWFDEAQRNEPRDPNAMTLATVSGDGLPSARTVLLKGWDRKGFVFYTNSLSHKGRDMAENQRVALLFYWKSLSRQVRISGQASKVTEQEADAYFASRPRDSQLGAWASDQSQPMPARDDFEHRLELMRARFDGQDVPRPPHWTGYRVGPEAMEFWEEREFRLHHRQAFTLDVEGWRSTLLFP